MSKRYPPEVRREVLEKVRGGRKVSEVAREHGINEMTVRNWLERETVSGAAEILEVSRLRRENEMLLRIVGQLTFEAERQKKNQRRVGG